MRKKDFSRNKDLSINFRAGLGGCFKFILDNLVYIQ